VFFIGGVRNSIYDYYNVDDFVLHKVGRYDQIAREINVTGEIIWPGFKNRIPNDKIPIVTVALLYPDTKYDGTTNPEGAAIKNGFDLAIEHINSDPTVLGSYAIEAAYIDTQQRTDTASSKIKRLTNQNPLGYVGP
jgi:ABC-type branched-subunit amino acid transport system substrate-binding protein